MKDIFLSQKNIVGLNTLLLNYVPNKKLNNEQKTQIIESLVNNMINSYHKLKFNNINNNNIQYVLKQYNNLNLKLTLSNLSNLNLDNDSEISEQSNFESESEIIENYTTSQPENQYNNLENYKNSYQNKNNSNINIDSIRQDRDSIFKNNNPNHINFNDNINNNTCNDNIDISDKLKQLENERSNIFNNSKPDNINFSEDNNLNNNNLNNNNLNNNNLNNISKSNTFNDDISILDKLKQLEIERSNLFDNNKPKDINFDVSTSINNTSSMNNIYNDLEPHTNNTNSMYDDLNTPMNNNMSTKNNDKLKQLKIERENINNLNTPITHKEPENNNVSYDKLENENINITNKNNSLTAENDLLKNNLNNTQALVKNSTENLNKEIIKYNLLLNKYNNNISNINNILSKYNNIINKKISKFISSNDMPSKNEFLYEIGETIKNVYKIQLNSYDIPNLKYNININNNKIKFKLGEEIDYDEDNNNIELPEQISNSYGEIIIIKYGNYTLDKLVNHINSLCYNTKIYAKLIDNSIYFKAIDFENKKQYKLNIFNFVNIIIDDDEYKDQIRLDNINLVNEKYIKIYIKNITDEEIGILSLNNLSYIEFELDNIQDIDNLDIQLKTLDDKLYDCNNLNTAFEFIFYSRIDKEEVFDF